MLVEIDELAIWLIPISIAIFFVKFYAIYLVSLYIVYFVTVRALEKIQVSNLNEKAVLITGCDSGFGWGLTLRCLGAGMPTFSACFDDNGRRRLEEEASKIKNGKELLTTFTLDVRNDDSVQKAKDLVEKKLEGKPYKLWAIVNNAGIGDNLKADCFKVISSAPDEYISMITSKYGKRVFDMRGWDDWQTPAVYQRFWDVNALGVIKVTHAFKHLLKRSKGRVVNVGSICSKLPMPSIAPYSVSKMAVAAYTDCIRAELSQWDIKVSMLEPGFFKTPQANPQASMDDAARVWERTPQSVKEEYGEAYFKWSQNAITQYLEYKCKPGAPLVVEAYFNAITSIFPRGRYQIGYDSTFQFNTLAYLPVRWQDWIFRFYWKFIAKPPKHAVEY
ncbi:hypothetical protein M3Y97_00361700 [Aphelenchoides bicaudatus]|nr:hypothetical protein M3Y97_00361700 [Aphelenchoides bicaudatus]